MLDQQLVVGKTYRFKFKSEFERHGVCTSSGVTCLHQGNGIFRLEEIATTHDILLQGVSMYENFFKPLGMSEAEANAYYNGKPDNAYTKEYVTRKIKTERTFTEVVPDGNDGNAKAILRKVEGERAEWVESGASVVTRQFFEDLSYSRFPIYKLVDVVDPDDVLYVPEKAIEGFPEVGIREYQNMTMAIDLGYWDNPGKLDGMLKSVRERLAVYGVQPLDISLFSADSRWMNPDEFKEVSKLQVPGALVKITEENYERYLHNSVVIDGTLKSIVVDESKITDPDTQVSLDAIICKKAQVIGPNLMLEEVPESELVYQSGNQYYKYREAGLYLKLNENVDWNPGDPIPHYEKTKDDSRDGSKKYFIDNGPVYAIIGDSTQKVEERSEEVLAYVAAGNALYKCNEYTLVPKDSILVAGGLYFQKDENGDFKIVEIPDDTTAPDGIYTHTENYSAATEAYVKANPTEVYFTKTSDHSFVESSISDMSKLYEKNTFLYLNFASDKMLALVGKNCEYTNPFGIRTTTQLDAEGIVVLATHETPMTISNQVVANLYKGRWFEFTVDIINQETHEVVGTQDCAVEITDTNWKDIKQYKGNIIGTGGLDCSIWRDVNVITDELSRSYYRMYVDAFRENIRLQAKVQALEAVINNIQS